ncbi:hypothetical protein ACF1G0_33045 [Streptomyces sp. NPDC013953]|uniref:hypothetical protein n=1 Tax=Streptomyces sp. NPDC013953 TaxID=3364868 RepID=UPI0036F8E3D6
MSEYETHVTVRCTGPAELVRLEEWAAVRALKVTHIVLARGRTVSQPMLTVPDRTSHETLVPQLRADGFHPVRVRVDLATLGSTWAVLAVGHNVADHVLGQSDHQAANKGAPTAADVAAGASPRRGWAACLAHVGQYHLVMAGLLALVWQFIPLPLRHRGPGLCAGGVRLPGAGPPRLAGGFR